jgi:hypothetical protein
MDRHGQSDKLSCARNRQDVEWGGGRREEGTGRCGEMGTRQALVEGLGANTKTCVPEGLHSPPNHEEDTSTTLVGHAPYTCVARALKARAPRRARAVHDGAVRADVPGWADARTRGAVAPASALCPLVGGTTNRK